MSTLPNPAEGRPICQFCNGTVHWQMSPTPTWVHDTPETNHAVVLSVTDANRKAQETHLPSEDSPDSYLAAMKLGVELNGSYDHVHKSFQMEAIRDAHLYLHREGGCQLSHCPYSPCDRPSCGICYPISGGG